MNAVVKSPETAESFWEPLFAGGEEPSQRCTVKMRLVRRGGRPWLLLPGEPGLAARVLELYPAQTPRARLARAGLCCALRARLPLGTEPISLTFSPAAGFVRFLTGLGAGEPASLPSLGILAGNPATAGRRFILLLFNAHGRPATVVKAGLGERARELITREERFLATVPRPRPGIPLLRGSFEEPGRRAFALDFFSGQSPSANSQDQLARLLNAWVDSSRQIPLAQTRPWRELQTTCASQPLWLALAQRLQGCRVHPAITHGDLAPWNIKQQAAGAWMVLDWERGDFEGIPGWDWFHYVIQPALLVAREASAPLAERLEQLFASAAFESYARFGGIAGQERELALIYLLHHNEVIRPSEGLAQGRELLNLLRARWLQGACA